MLGAENCFQCCFSYPMIRHKVHPPFPVLSADFRDSFHECVLQSCRYVHGPISICPRLLEEGFYTRPINPLQHALRLSTPIISLLSLPFIHHISVMPFIIVDDRSVGIRFSNTHYSPIAGTPSEFQMTTLGFAAPGILTYDFYGMSIYISYYFSALYDCSATRHLDICIWQPRQRQRRFNRHADNHQSHH